MGKLVIVVINTKKQHANMKIRILNVSPAECTWWVPGLNSPSSLGLSSHGASDHLGSLLGAHSIAPKSLVLGRPSMATALQIQVSDGGDRFPWPLLPLRPSMLLASFATRAHHSLTFNWMATRTQGPLLYSCFLVRGLHFSCCIGSCVKGEIAEPITNK